MLRQIILKIGIFLTGMVALFIGGVSELLQSSKERYHRWSEKYMPKCNSLKNGNLPERKELSSLRVSELLPSLKKGWRRIKWNYFGNMKRPENLASSWEEVFSYLPEGEWAVAESQRGMMQDKVKFVCKGTTPWKTKILFRGLLDLFNGAWVSCCWVTKRHTNKCNSIFERLDSIGWKSSLLFSI